jgi:hypothetical protein
LDGKSAIAVTVVASLWSFLSRKKNQQTLAWLGGGAVVAAGGIWAVVTYVWPSHDEKPTAPTAQAGNCGIASVGSSTGNSIKCENAPAAPAKP